VKYVKSILQHGVIPTFDSLIDVFIPDTDPNKPYYKIAWNATKGAFGFLAEYMPEEAEDFMQQFGVNRKKITKELFASREFEQSLIITFDALIRTRGEYKRKIIKRAFFKGYIPSKEKKLFELERLYITSQNISIDAAEYLGFLKKEILPLYVAELEQKQHQPKYRDGRPLSPNTISYFVANWINKQFDISDENIKEIYSELDNDETLQKGLSKKKLYYEDKFEEHSSEYTSLGIFKTTGTTFNGKPAYTFTEFGLRYLNYLEA